MVGWSSVLANSQLPRAVVGGSHCAEAHTLDACPPRVRKPERPGLRTASHVDAFTPGRRTRVDRQVAADRTVPEAPERDTPKFSRFREFHPDTSGDVLSVAALRRSHAAGQDAEEIAIVLRRCILSSLPAADRSVVVRCSASATGEHRDRDDGGQHDLQHEAHEAHSRSGITVTVTCPRIHVSIARTSLPTADFGWANSLR
jgi:hypothetical protein